MIKETTVCSLEQYTRHTEQYKGRALFRGQANKHWSIVPSLFRNDISQESQFISREIEKNDNATGIISTMFHMQHYGIPTRLIDLTISPYSALFFALDDQTQETQDGVVYVLDKVDTIQSKSIMLEKFAEMLLVESEYIKCPTELLDFAQSDHIIQYEGAYSYTNDRAMLQGGTSLCVGLGYDGDVLSRIKPCCFDNLILEKIVIPHEYKTALLLQLKALGYCAEVLYGEWESLQTTNSFDLIREQFDVEPRVGFIKIVAKFRVNNILYDKDVLANKIIGIYNQCFQKYGDNARVWLFISFDQKDYDMANWICRTEWNDRTKWQFQWNKDYYKSRMNGINEEISFEMLYNKIHPLIECAEGQMKLISNAVKKSRFSECSCLLKDGKMKALNMSKVANGIPYTSAEYEPFARAGLAFINDVERLYTEMGIYMEREESDGFLSYWCDVLLDQCYKSQIKLKKVSDELGIMI